MIVHDELISHRSEGLTVNAKSMAGRSPDYQARFRLFLPAI
jgi:hypothetical protein